MAKVTIYPQLLTFRQAAHRGTVIQEYSWSDPLTPSSDFSYRLFRHRVLHCTMQTLRTSLVRTSVPSLILPTAASSLALLWLSSTLKILLHMLSHDLLRSLWLLLTTPQYSPIIGFLNSTSAFLIESQGCRPEHQLTHSFTP
jgi:hypothetical protein